MHLYCPWKRINYSHLPLIFAQLFQRLTVCYESHLQIFPGIMYFVILSLKINSSNSCEIWFSFRGSYRRLCDYSWRSITFPFFPIWYNLFQYPYFLQAYLGLTYFFFNSFDFVRSNWTIITLSVNRLLWILLCFRDRCQSIVDFLIIWENFWWICLFFNVKCVSFELIVL